MFGGRRMYDFFLIVFGIVFVGTCWLGNIIYKKHKSKQPYQKQVIPFTIGCVLVIVLANVSTYFEPEETVKSPQVVTASKDREATTHPVIKQDDESTNKTRKNTAPTENIETNEDDAEEQLPKKIRGRGISDSGREPPEYEGLIGYAVISTGRANKLEQTDNFTNIPWTIPIYEKTSDGNYLVTASSIEHKTEINVIEQNLEHMSYGNYRGYLLVSEVSTSEEYYISVDNFFPRAYWKEVDLEDAAIDGIMIAEYHNNSGISPVTGDNKRVNLEEGMTVLITGKTQIGLGDSPNRNRHQIKCKVFKEWKKGYGGVDVYFNKEDLVVIY